MSTHTPGPINTLGHPSPALSKSDPMKVVVSGSMTGRVLHAAGNLSEPGSRLVMALAEQSVRDGCSDLRLDLADLTMVEIACVRSLRRFQTLLHSNGTTLRFTDPDRDSTSLGLTTCTDAGAAVPV